MGKNEGVFVIAVGALLVLVGPAMLGGAQPIRYVGLIAIAAGVIAMWVAHRREVAAQRQDSTR